MSIDVTNMNEEGKKKIAGAVKQIAFCMNTIAGEKEAIKDIINEMADQFDVDKKILRKVAAAYHKDSFSAVQEENTTFETTYMSVMGNNRV